MAASLAVLFLTDSAALFGIFAIDDPVVVELGTQLLRYLSVSAFFITVALTFTGGLQGTGDTREPALHHARVAGRRADGALLHPPGDRASDARRRVDRRSCSDTPPAAHLSIWRFQQGRWKTIKVE